MINTHVFILSCETMDARGPADTAMMPSSLTVTVLIPSMTTPPAQALSIGHMRSHCNTGYQPRTWGCV